MYESPIAKIFNEMQTQMLQEEENMVMKAIRQVGIDVDKEELINALQYDRKQYTKGYADGKSDTLDKIRVEIEQEYTKFCNKSDMWSERACGLGMALEIIDKYKAESEEV